MKSKTQERIVGTFALFIMGTVLVFTVARLFFGADLSDEAYAVAETYMVSEGALPFVNNWSQMPGFTLLLAPFVKLFTLITGGTDGIFLYFRFLAFFIHSLTAVTVSYLMKDHIKNRKLLVLFSMIYVGANGRDYGIAFRGDRLAVDLLAVGILLIALFFADAQNKLQMPFISGVFLALSVLSFPSFLIMFGLLSLAIIYLSFKRKKGYKILLCFFAGAAMAALLVTGYLAINSSISDIIHGIGYILKDVTYFQIQNTGIAKLPAYVKDMVGQIILLMLFSAGSFAVVGFGLLRKRWLRIEADHYLLKRTSVKQAALISVVCGICMYHLFLIWKYKTGDNENITIYAMTIQTIALPLVYCFIKTEKKLCRYLMSFISIPTYVVVVITGIGTYNSMQVRHLLLKNSAYLLGVFVFFAVNDVFSASVSTGDTGGSRGNICDVLYGLCSKIMPSVLMMTVTFTYLFNSYTYVYRDESFWRLNTVVPEGPYKGMRTTETRAKGLIELDRIIDQYVDEDDYILAMDNDPFIYLMSKGRMCTPSTWDMALYSYGFDQPDLYYDYFSVMGMEPTKIIYFNYGRDEIMSIDVDYKFNDYVYSNYHKIYENRNLFEWNYYDKDVMCELIIFDRN